MNEGPRPDRVLRTIAASLVACFVLGVGTSAAAVIPPGRTGVGDSIMLSVKPGLRALGWVGVHAVVGRGFADGVRVVRRLAADGRLSKRVIVELGTNGPVDPADCEELVRLAGPSRWVFLVTNKVPRWWQDPNNRVLNACANAHPKVDVIRWWAHSHTHPRWFASDRYHLSAVGETAFTSFVEASVDAIVSGGGRGLR